jgi:hypothetical protein
LLGVKHMAILYSLVLIALFFWSSKSKKKHFLILLAAFAASSAFWYVRNWIYTGNPVFPVTVEIFGLRIFDGIIAANTPWEPIKEMLKSINIWAGPELLLFAVSAYLLYRKKLLLRGPDGQVNKKLIPLLLIPFVSIVLFFKIPVHSLNEHRFLAPALFVMDIIIMYAALNYKKLLYAMFILQFIIIVPQWYKGITWYTDKISFDSPENLLAHRYGDEAKSWAFASHNCSRIATTGNNLNYHLFGDKYKNEVRYINPTEYEGIYLHEISANARKTDGIDAGYPDLFYRNKFSLVKWSARIKEYKPDCIYIAGTPDKSLSGTGTEKTIEELWMEQTNGLSAANRHAYMKVFSNSKAVVWSILPPKL